MFNNSKFESQKELIRKSNRYLNRSQKPLTEKITNETFTNVYIPKNTETIIPPGQRYMNNFPQNSLRPYHTQSNMIKVNKINRSRNYSNKNDDLYEKENISRNNQNEFNIIRNKTQYKNKRTSSNYINKTLNKEDILRTTNDSRTRKIYSMASDIFNLDNCSTNLVNDSSFFNNSINDSVNNICNSVDNIHLGNEENHANKNIKYFNIEDNDDNSDNNSNSNCNCDSNLNIGKKNYPRRSKKFGLNLNSSKGLLEKGNGEFSIKKARSIYLNRLKSIRNDVENKKYNRINLILNKDFTNTDFIPFLHGMNSKTNASNIESVNYDIISNKKNNLYDKYNKLSNQKASVSEYDNYEIIIPKDYNKLDGQKLKNMLHAEGVHFFGFSEQANIGGDKGKFKFKIRKSNLDKNDINNCVKKLSKKLSSSFNVKLKKTDEVNERKTTEITQEYGAEIVANHLQNDENDKSANNKIKTGAYSRKKNLKIEYDMKYKNYNLFKNKKFDVKKRKKTPFKKKK